ncbi:MAG TPA: HEAT repeat domain-containing protein [Candidatus Eremiobacteraceae bacterium]|nr:HEAT repeat domain-containing protein [Candidatus Eremiobacteraceae bacterium]
MRIDTTLREIAIADLLKRFADDGPSLRGDQTESWYAYRDAEKAADPAWLPILAALLLAAKPPSRSAIYFIIAQLGKNCAPQAAFSILNEWLSREKNKSCIHSILSALGELPLPNIEQITPFTRDPRWLVRQEAIYCLRGDTSGEAEEVLLRVLESSKNQYDMGYALSALSKVGSRKAIPRLAAMSQHPKANVQVGVVHAISKIGDQREVPFFVEALAGRNTKWAAMEAVRAHGDAGAIPAVAARVGSILKRTRKIEQDPSELVLGLEFLKRFEKVDSVAKRALDAARKVPRERLFDSEAAWVRENL